MPRRASFSTLHCIYFTRARARQELVGNFTFHFFHRARNYVSRSRSRSNLTSNRTVHRNAKPTPRESPHIPRSSIIQGTGALGDLWNLLPPPSSVHACATFTTPQHFTAMASINGMQKKSRGHNGAPAPAELYKVTPLGAAITRHHVRVTHITRHQLR